MCRIPFPLQSMSIRRDQIWTGRIWTQIYPDNFYRGNAAWFICGVDKMVIEAV